MNAYHSVFLFAHFPSGGSFRLIRRIRLILPYQFSFVKCFFHFFENFSVCLFRLVYSTTFPGVCQVKKAAAVNFFVKIFTKVCQEFFRFFILFFWWRKKSNLSSIFLKQQQFACETFHKGCQEKFLIFFDQFLGSAEIPDLSSIFCSSKKKFVKTFTKKKKKIVPLILYHISGALSSLF